MTTERAVDPGALYVYCEHAPPREVVEAAGLVYSVGLKLERKRHLRYYAGLLLVDPSNPQPIDKMVRKVHISEVPNDFAWYEHSKFGDVSMDMSYFNLPANQTGFVMARCVLCGGLMMQRAITWRTDQRNYEKVELFTSKEVTYRDPPVKAPTNWKLTSDIDNQRIKEEKAAQFERINAAMGKLAEQLKKNEENEKKRQEILGKEYWRQLVGDYRWESILQDSHSRDSITNALKSDPYSLRGALEGEWNYRNKAKPEEGMLRLCRYGYEGWGLLVVGVWKEGLNIRVHADWLPWDRLDYENADNFCKAFENNITVYHLHRRGEEARERAREQQPMNTGKELLAQAQRKPGYGVRPQGLYYSRIFGRWEKVKT